MLAQRRARYPRMACIYRRGGRAENCATCNPLATGREAEAASRKPTANSHQPASHSVSDKRRGAGYLLFACRPLLFAFNPAQATHCPWVDGWRSEGPCAAWVRRMRRTGWAGRPTPALPCVQDCTHEQAALRAPMGEGALLAKHCFASGRTHSRQRLGRTAERGSRRVLHCAARPPNPRHKQAPTHSPGNPTAQRQPNGQSANQPGS